MAELTYREILPQRSVDDNSFSRGVQNFIWSLGHPTSCILNKSYFRFEVEVNPDRTVGDAPILSNLIAPADNAISCLYNNVQFYAGGRQVSQCINGCPQASQCKARLTESSATLETLGADAKLLEGEFMKRQQMVCGDAQKSSLSPDRDMRPLTNVMADQRTATIAIDAAGAVTGVDTTLQDFTAGDTLVVGDYRFQFQEITSDTTAVVTPAPVQAIPAENDAYVIKQTPTISKGAYKFFVMWCPPIGAFDISTPLPSGDYRIAMNPSQDYKSAAIESLLGSQAAPANPAYYNFKVNGVRFYLATVKMTVPQSLEATIYEQEVQSKPFTTASNTLNFTIPASTRAISVFFQSDDAGKNTLIPPTKFQVFPNGGVEKPALTLENIQLTYANQTKPSVRWESNYDRATLTNELQQRYYDTYLHAGMLGPYQTGGIDRFEEFLEKGLLVHYSWDRDSDDRSTELQVSASFSQALGAGSSMYVVAWYRRVLAIDSVAGQVREVLTRTA
jgi:hypothetical protein